MSKELSPLGQRMKEYEKAYDFIFPNNVPIIVRIDGKNFSTYTKNFNKPFDDIVTFAMVHTMKYLCANISNCRFGYTQSDEITLVLFEKTLFDKENDYKDIFIKTPYESFEKSVPFNNRAMKSNSLFASMATMVFNRYFKIAAHMVFCSEINGSEILPEEREMWDNNKDELRKWTCRDNYQTYVNKFDSAMFDSRMFVVPTFDIINNIIFRQEDAIKNSISAYARCYIKDTDGKNGLQLQEELKELGLPWDELPLFEQHGTCCYKENVVMFRNGKPFSREKWVIDKEMPIIKDNKEWFLEKIL